METNAAVADLLESEALPGDDQPVPYFIVGDKAFPMRDWLKQPYPPRGLHNPKRNFNARSGIN